MFSPPRYAAAMRIRSTQALRALVAFARHGTVWQAAAALNQTRSATRCACCNGVWIFSCLSRLEHGWNWQHRAALMPNTCGKHIRPFRALPRATRGRGFMADSYARASRKLPAANGACVSSSPAQI